MERVRPATFPRPFLNRSLVKIEAMQEENIENILVDVRRTAAYATFEPAP